MEFQNPAEARGESKYWNVSNNLVGGAIFSLSAQHGTLVVVITWREGERGLSHALFSGPRTRGWGEKMTCRRFCLKASGSTSLLWGWPSPRAGSPEKLKSLPQFLKILKSHCKMKTATDLQNNLFCSLQTYFTVLVSRFFVGPHPLCPVDTEQLLGSVS